MSTSLKGVQAIQVSSISIYGEGARVGDSSVHFSKLICHVLQISSGDIHEQRVNTDTLRAIVNESTVVSESLQANSTQGHVYDNQGGISGNHVNKGGQVFSNGVEETESWLKELSKYETCPIEKEEVPSFMQLLQVMGLSLVKIKGTSGSFSKNIRFTREKDGKNVGESTKKGVRELRNLASSVNYERRREITTGEHVS